MQLVLRDHRWRAVQQQEEKVERLAGEMEGVPVAYDETASASSVKP